MSAVITTIKKHLPDLTNKIFDYGSIADFKRLWSFENLPTDRILITWGRTAGDGTLWPIEASSCLTPLDWAAAYIESLGGAVGRKWPQILILDAIPDRQPDPPSLARCRTLNEKQLPWLRVPEHPGLTDILEWLGRDPAVPTDVITKAHKLFLEGIRLGLTKDRPRIFSR